MRRRKTIKVCLALLVLSITSLFVLANIAHQRGKRLGILSSINRVFAGVKGPPEGYPITAVTRKGETIYFDVITLDLIDASNPQLVKPSYFRLETDMGGQLGVRTTLQNVTKLQVIKLPTFSKSSARPDPSSQIASSKGFDPALLWTDRNVDRMKNTEPEPNPLKCRLRLTFDSEKVLEGNVTVHHVDFENRVWGDTPEGPRCLSLPDIDYIRLPKPKGK
jgi:hypothetical protein